MILHTINKSPTSDSTFNSCLRCAAEHDTILLFEDGIYGAIVGTQAEPMIKQALQHYRICALKEDLVARGFSRGLIDGIDVIDYQDFVDLTVTHDKVHSWY